MTLTYSQMKALGEHDKANGVPWGDAVLTGFSSRLQTAYKSGWFGTGRKAGRGCEARVRRCGGRS